MTVVSPPVPLPPTQKELDAYAVTLNKAVTNFISALEPETTEEIYQRLRFFPNQVLLETSSYCNLDCVMCARQFHPRQWGRMREATALRVIDEVVTHAPWARMWFCYFGEPLVSKKIGLYERIRYAKDKGLQRAAINTNGTLLDARAVRDLLAAGLDEIYVGIDAATAETYAKVRRGGDFRVVMDNVLNMIQIAGERLQITVQFAVLEENEHELIAFQEYWSAHPVQVYIRPKMTWINRLPDKVKTGQERRHACAWLFDSINVTESGDVPFCVNDWAGQHVHGNVNDASLFHIWQTRVRPFLEAHARGDWAALPKFCQECPDWQVKRPRNLEAMTLFANPPTP